MWLAGARELATASAEVDVDGDPPADFARALDAVRVLGAQAARSRTTEQRVETYGQLLRTCADCHRAPFGPVR